jgi:hypothetical protein
LWGKGVRASMNEISTAKLKGLEGRVIFTIV